MAVRSARWQRLPQSMQVKDFPSGISIFFELGNEIICSESNGTLFENGENRKCPLKKKKKRKRKCPLWRFGEIED